MRNRLIELIGNLPFLAEYEKCNSIVEVFMEDMKL